jgi:hypothetical protein
MLQLLTKGTRCTLQGCLRDVTCPGGPWLRTCKDFPEDEAVSKGVFSKRPVGKVSPVDRFSALCGTREVEWNHSRLFVSPGFQINPVSSVDYLDSPV